MINLKILLVLAVTSLKTLQKPAVINLKILLAPAKTISQEKEEATRKLEVDKPGRHIGALSIKKEAINFITDASKRIKKE